MTLRFHLRTSKLTVQLLESELNISQQVDPLNNNYCLLKKKVVIRQNQLLSQQVVDQTLKSISRTRKKELHLLKLLNNPKHLYQNPLKLYLPKPYLQIRNQRKMMN